MPTVMFICTWRSFLNCAVLTLIVISHFIRQEINDVSKKYFYELYNGKKLNTIPQEIVLPMLNDVLSHLFLVFMSLMLHK